MNATPITKAEFKRLCDFLKVTPPVNTNKIHLPWDVKELNLKAGLYEYVGSQNEPETDKEHATNSIAEYFDSMMKAGSDGRDIAEGTVMALHRFLKDHVGAHEMSRLARLLVSGTDAAAPPTAVDYIDAALALVPSDLEGARRDLDRLISQQPTEKALKTVLVRLSKQIGLIEERVAHGGFMNRAEFYDLTNDEKHDHCSWLASNGTDFYFWPVHYVEWLYEQSRDAAEPAPAQAHPEPSDQQQIIRAICDLCDGMKRIERAMIEFVAASAVPSGEAMFQVKDAAERRRRAESKLDKLCSKWSDTPDAGGS